MGTAQVEIIGKEMFDSYGIYLSQVSYYVMHTDYKTLISLLNVNCDFVSLNFALVYELLLASDIVDYKLL